MKPFLQRSETSRLSALRAPGVPVAAAMPALGAHGAGAAHAGSAHVEVVKEGDRVVRLVVTCACGERIDVECLYPPAG